jgi:septum formation inhibitor-activating ATPase MinD
LVGAVISQIPDVASVIDCDRFIDKLKHLRVTAYVNRFISLLKSRVKGTKEQIIAHGLNLSAAEILRTENMWIRSVQESSFAEELKYLRSKSKASLKAMQW